MRGRTELLFATLPALALAAAIGTTGACTSSATSVTSPSAQKCQVTAAASPTSFNADGGSGTLTISAARDCTWSLGVDAGWVAVSGDRGGQGDAQRSYSVGANAQAVSRAATVAVGSESVRLSQAAAPCRFALSQPSDAIDASGGSLSVGLTTLAGCSWSAASSAPWIAIASGPSGTASATIALSVAPNPGAARVGQVNVAGQIYTVNQSAASTPGPTPTPTPGGDVESFAGAVSNVSGRCPNLSFNVADRTVMTDKSTQFKDISCGDVAKGGRSVTGQGPTDSNGVIHADIVKKWSD